MAHTTTKAFLDGVEYAQGDFAVNHAGVFGSTAKFDFSVENLRLTIKDGYFLSGGYFYQMLGDRAITVANNSQGYIWVRRGFQSEQITFGSTSTFMTDTETAYQCSFIRWVSQNGVITQTYVVGSNTSIAYNNIMPYIHDTGWINIILTNGAVSYAGDTIPRYRRIGKLNIVEGAVRGYTGTSTPVTWDFGRINNIPNASPVRNQPFMSTVTSSGYGNFLITTTGMIRITYASSTLNSNSWITFDHYWFSD